MNPDDLTQILQQGLRVTLGATASLVETLQNPQKRTQRLSQIESELSQLAQEWALKGEMTEQEARNFVDSLLTRQSPSPTPTDASDTAATPRQQTTPPTSAELELQELTAQIAAIRAELEKLRGSESGPS
ncbi:MAG: hypothetical protein NVS2B14_21690 [Chamaesiphon sp.]